ncbi:thiamine pyrophosphate-binding protein [Nocardia farcinica]|nr:thiamine pyrophosphate-binding protein [Nocardia farcinica]
MPDRVADQLVHTLAHLGVRHVFGVDGANIEDLYDALYDSPVTGVIAKHEFSAATMADGYARATGFGVVAATSGGGAMNLVAGLAESFASRVPVLALVGQPPTGLAGRGAFQDTSGAAGTIDAAVLFGSISRYCARVDSARELPVRLDRAVTAARQGGPAVLLLPKDVQQAEGYPCVPVPLEPRHVHDRAGLEHVRAMLHTARRLGKVVIVAGDQVARDDARAELAALAGALDAAVAVTPEAKDCYDDTAPGFCGVVGTMGHAEAAAALRTGAVCLLVGATMTVTARAGLTEQLAAIPLVSVGASSPFLPARHAASTDLAVTLAELAEEFGGAGGTAGPERAVRPLGAAVDHPTPAADAAAPAGPHPGPTLTAMSVPPSAGPGLRYRVLVQQLSDALAPGTDVVCDAGNTGAAVVHHLRVPPDGRFTVALGMGGMGYAFGSAIGSAFARGRRTVVIAGDGAFYMHGMEVHTAVEYGLPVTVVVLNNNAHAMCVTREQVYYGDRYSYNRFRPAHLGAGIAAMFPGLPVRTARTPAELAAALPVCLPDHGPAFLEIVCDPDEMPPFAPFHDLPRRSP